MEGLRGIHGPCDGEAQRGQSERNQKYYDGHQQNLRKVEVYACEGREDEEDHPLNGGKRCAAQNLTQHNCGARHRRHQSPRAEILPCGPR